MESKDYLKDISDIKSLMIKSSRFISLTGVSGIASGVYALAGASYAYWLVSNIKGGYASIDDKTFNLILFDLIIVGFLSIITTIFLTRKKAKRDNENVWDLTIKKMVYSFLTTLIAGGIYITIIISKQDYEQAGALMLIFYGLAIINGAKHTLKDVRFLGYIEVLLGLIFALFPEYGFWIWVLGFGVLHIVYGSLMYFKHEKNNSSYKS